MLREIAHELLGVAPRLVRIDFELRADSASHNIRQRRTTIRRLPNDRSHFIESEKSRVHCRHNHHFPADEAGSNGRTPRNVLLGYDGFSSG